MIQTLELLSRSLGRSAIPSSHGPLRRPVGGTPKQRARSIKGSSRPVQGPYAHLPGARSLVDTDFQRYRSRVCADRFSFVAQTNRQTITPLRSPKLRSTMQEKQRRYTPSQFTAVVAGLVLGKIAGDSSTTIAKVLHNLSPGVVGAWHIAQTSLVLIFLAACISAFISAIATKRCWASADQVVWSWISALLVLSLTIFDQYYPDPVDDSKLPILETMYYVGWILALWFGPTLALLCRPISFSRRVQICGGLMALVSILVAIGLLVGLIIIEVGEKLWPALNNGLCGGAHSNDPRKFWLASPPVINGLSAALFVVILLPIWWTELWSRAPTREKAIWIIAFSLFSFTYAGTFGGVFYVDRNWAKVLVDSGLVSGWGFFYSFGAFPVTLITVALVLYTLTHKPSPVGASWPVRRSFWLILPIGLAVGFGAVAYWGLASIARLDDVCSHHGELLAIGHAANGFVLGVVLSFSQIVLRSLRNLLLDNRSSTQSL